jgi:hypothetical protein
MRKNLWGIAALGAVLLFGVAGTAEAEVITPLSDLLVEGATLPSHDGSVLFDDFTYIPTVDAPDPEAINIITDETVPQGFKVQGPFQAFNGRDFDVLFGFDATVTAEGGFFTDASLEMIASTAVGVSMDDPLVGSSISILEEIDSPGGENTDMLVWDTAVAGGDVLEDSTALLGFGRTISVLKDIGLITISPELAGEPTAAAMSLFTQNFANIPEPATWALLMAVPALAVVRRR